MGILAFFIRGRKQPKSLPYKKYQCIILYISSFHKSASE